MTKLALVINDELCFDCKACEVACKQENAVPAGVRWITVISSGPKKVGEKLVTKFSPETCHHCAKAPCIEVCPVDAINQQPNGIVLIDKDRCIGCGDCITACPFSVIGLDPKNNVAQKCTLCIHRVEKGLSPACANACPSRAIYFGDINDISLKLREERAQKRI